MMRWLFGTVVLAGLLGACEEPPNSGTLQSDLVDPDEDTTPPLSDAGRLPVTPKDTGGEAFCQGRRCKPGSFCCFHPDGSERCVDVMVSPEHCGACGSACRLGEACEQGHCAGLRCSQDFRIVGVDPAQNARVDGSAGALTTRLSCDIDGASLSEDTVMIRSAFAARFPGTLELSAPNAVTFKAVTGDWHAGDVITTTLTSGLASSTGKALSPPYVWQARVSVAPSAGFFIDSEQGLGGGGTSALGVGDLDGDGDLDVVFGYRELRVWENFDQWPVSEGRGRYEPRATLDVEYTRGVALGDLDGDGDLDLVVSSATAPVWLGDGEGGFEDSLWRPDDTSWSVPMALGDLDGDGDLDGYDAKGRAWLNDGNAHFSKARVSAFDEDNVGYDVAIADLDGDGDLDGVVLVWSNTLHETAYITRNDGAGHLLVAETIELGSTPYGVDLGDIDGDGDVDAVLSTGAILRNLGSTLTHEPGALERSNDVVLGDIDGDGDLDVLTAAGWSGNNAIWLNDGAGVFVDSGQRLGLSNTKRVALADIDGDGDLDALLANDRFSITDTNTRGTNQLFINSTCPGCPGQTCKRTCCPLRVNPECISGACDGKRCVSPSCHDGLRNQDEVDVDCGGERCPGCPADGPCELDGDCASQICLEGGCQAASCEDGVRNGSETDVDCGGGRCPLCRYGQRCLVDIDCTAGECAQGLCLAGSGEECPVNIPGRPGPNPGPACSPEGQTCDYGQECCCGECSPSMTCLCIEGLWLCYYTDACLGMPFQGGLEGDACFSGFDCCWWYQCVDGACQ